MRFRRNVQYEFGLKAIHLASFMGVALLLLLVFFFPGGFVTPQGLGVSLPRQFTAEGFVAGKTIEIVLDEQGSMSVDGRPAARQMLKELLAVEGKGGCQVLIKAHKRAPLAAVTGVWELCREAGVDGVNLLSNE
jgi:biopolymer transport protein ExbD